MSRPDESRPVAGTDVVERLRARTPIAKHTRYDCGDEAADLIETQAAEIARLRAEADAATASIRTLGEETVLAGYPGGDRTQVLANVRSLRARVAELERDCGEAYQVVGVLTADLPADPAVTKALDNLSAAAAGRPRPHDDLLPFGPTPDPRDARIAELEAALRNVSRMRVFPDAVTNQTTLAAAIALASRALGDAHGR